MQSKRLILVMYALLAVLIGGAGAAHWARVRDYRRLEARRAAVLAGKISMIRAIDAAVEDVASALGEAAGCSVRTKAGPEADERITLVLYDVTLEQALRALLPRRFSTSYGWAWTGESISIQPNDSYDEPPSL